MTQTTLTSDLLPFVVRFCLVIDHPEKRSSSFAPVAAGRYGKAQAFETQAAAVSFFSSLVAGDDDFGSEYPTNVQVLQLRAGRSPRAIRKMVVRERDELGAVRTVV